jgi:hypothetical protein
LCGRPSLCHQQDTGCRTLRRPRDSLHFVRAPFTLPPTGHRLQDVAPASGLYRWRPSAEVPLQAPQAKSPLPPLAVPAWWQACMQTPRAKCSTERIGVWELYLQSCSTLACRAGLSLVARAGLRPGGIRDAACVPRIHSGVVGAGAIAGLLSSAGCVCEPAAAAAIAKALCLLESSGGARQHRAEAVLVVARPGNCSTSTPETEERCRCASWVAAACATHADPSRSRFPLLSHDETFHAQAEAAACSIACRLTDLAVQQAVLLGIAHRRAAGLPGADMADGATRAPQALFAVDLHQYRII